METIFAPITAITKSGISVIRISGPKTIECLHRLGFKGTPQHQKISFQKISNPKNQELLDEVLISFFRSPQSFTGEDVAEISIHASPFILRKICEILSEEKNVRLAEAGEFSKRAFLNGKLDLVQAEAIPDLIAAETELQHRQALQQLEGRLGKIYEDWRFRLIEASAMLEAAIDFPDEDLPQEIIDSSRTNAAQLIKEIQEHLHDNKVGQKIKDGLSLAIIGAPNVGKSSLINFLAQSEVAIVSEIPGTTRDVIDVHLSIAGVPVKISDTAGLRETEDLIEKEGIRRALKKAENADLKILMIDASSAPSHEIEGLIDDRTVVVFNKIDLLNSQKMSSFTSEFPALKVSLSNKINLSELVKKLEEKIQGIVPTSNYPLITQERYRVALKNSVTYLEDFLQKNDLQKNIELAAEELRMTAREIGKISGKVDVENILDVIFSRFCIGK